MGTSIITGVSGVETTLSSTPAPLKQKQKNSISVRKMIIEADKARRPHVSDIYRELLRSLINIFSNFSYINSENDSVEVQCIFANQERAIAKQFEEQNIILPIFSVGQTTTDEDNTRGRYNSIIVANKVWDEDKQRWRRTVNLPDKPVTINYDLNIYAKYRSDLDQLLEQVRFCFNPVMEVPTKYSTVTKATIETESDIGDAQVDDKQDRILKKTLKLTLQSWIPSPKFLMTSTGEIESVISDMQVSST